MGTFQRTPLPLFLGICCRVISTVCARSLRILTGNGILGRIAYHLVPSNVRSDVRGMAQRSETHKRLRWWHWHGAIDCGFGATLPLAAHRRAEVRSCCGRQRWGLDYRFGREYTIFWDSLSYMFPASVVLFSSLSPHNPPLPPPSQLVGGGSSSHSGLLTYSLFCRHGFTRTSVSRSLRRGGLEHAQS